MPKLIEVRKLAAVDMAWLGARIVLAEYALGVVLPLALGMWSVWVGVSRGSNASLWEVAVGIWLMSIGANYIPLLVYARAIAKAGSVEREGRPEMSRARRYGVQQAIILVPFIVVVVAWVQARRRRREKQAV